MTDPAVNEGIRDLAGRYADAVTRWDTDAIAGCFADDATWTAGPLVGEGRSDVVRVMSGVRARYDWLVHLLHSVLVVESDGREVVSRAYASELARRGGRPTLFVNQYDDRCTETANGWVFLSRDLTVLYAGPPDLSAAPSDPVTRTGGELSGSR